MASRENQTLQISLMAIAILLLIFVVATYWIYSLLQASEDKVTQLESTISTNSKDVQTSLQDVRSLKEMIGFKEEDNLATVTKAYDADMKKYAADFEKKQRLYRDIMIIYHGESGESTRKETEIKAQLKELKTKMLALESQKNEQIKTHEKEALKANQEAAKERSLFTKEREAFKTETARLNAEYTKKRDELEMELSKRSEKIAELGKKYTLAQKQIKRLKELLGDQEGEVHFEVADGKVDWVNQRNRTVMVNLGYLDGLKTQISFSIYEQGQPIRPKGSKKEEANPSLIVSDKKDPFAPKAKIEIIRIIDKHLSEARIVSDELSNPILPGDQVYTPAWHRGKAMHFAIVGDIDVDSDGQTDMKRMLDIVRLGGGVVDVYVSKDGKKNGKLSVETRFVVQGKTPQPGTPRYEAMQEVVADANRMGIDVISLQKMLNLMGWEATERAVPLGKNARASDFRAKLPGGVQKTDVGGSTSGLFRKRHPRVPY